MCNVLGTQIQLFVCKQNLIVTTEAEVIATETAPKSADFYAFKNKVFCLAQR